MHMSCYVIVLECLICTRGHPLIYKFCIKKDREIRDGLKCMCAIVIIILDRVPTCIT